VRKYLALALIQVLILTGCGGGGGGGGSGSSPPPPVSACSGATSSNVEPIIVDEGPTALQNARITAVNVAYVSVKVCVPGSASYQTIDHIQVDTQSSGLRILASALTSITLPYQLDSSGNTMAECLQFADGSSWGSLAVADIQLPTSGEKAAGVTVQLIGDPTVEDGRPAPSGTAPNTFCSAPAEDTVATFGANGIIGVGPYTQDCGAACIPGSGNPLPLYYGCVTPVTAPASCTAENVPLAQQLTNTVTLFATDNNGTIVALPSVGATGESTVSGSLVLGIGTETNNAIPVGVTVLKADPNNSAYLTATLVGTGYTGTGYTHSYLDSGSNGNFFGETPAITQCGPSQQGFYCPTNTLNFTTTLTGTNNMPTPSEPFSVANASGLFTANPTFAAFSNLGGTNGDPASLDLGLAFFYGQNVYTAVEGATVAGNAGPFYALSAYTAF
jgi:hypothetical protein